MTEQFFRPRAIRSLTAILRGQWGATDYTGVSPEGDSFEQAQKWSGLSLTFVLRDPRFHDSLDKRQGQWLVRGELHGPLGCGEALKLFLKRLDHRRPRE